MTHRELAKLAYGMLDRSYSPYSKFPVGAALLCADRSEERRVGKECTG